MIGSRIVGTLAGAGFCVAVISAVELVGHRLLGVPAEPAQASPAMITMVLLAWVFRTAIEGFVGVRIAKWRGTAWIVAGLVILGVLNQVMVPTPLWFSALGLGWFF